MKGMRRRRINHFRSEIGSRRRWLTIRFSTWSGTFLDELHIAWADEWENIIGAFDVASASSMVGTETCDRSTIMPRRFISDTTSCNWSVGERNIQILLADYVVVGKITVPKCDRPPMCGTCPGSSTLQQSNEGKRKKGQVIRFVFSSFSLAFNLSFSLANCRTLSSFGRRFSQ